MCFDLELLAILWAHQRFQSTLMGHVQIFLDNMTVVYYLNKQGGTEIWGTPAIDVFNTAKNKKQRGLRP